MGKDSSGNLLAPHPNNDVMFQAPVMRQAFTNPSKVRLLLCHRVKLEIAQKGFIPNYLGMKETAG
jgi:hypothetical protein